MFDGERRVVVDGDALARGKPVLLQHHAATPSTQLRDERPRRVTLALPKRSGARHPHASGVGDVVTEGLRGLDSCCRLRRAERRDPGFPQRVHDACRQGRLGPDDHQVRRDRSRRGDHRRGVRRIHVWQAAHARLGADRRTPWCHDDLVHARLAGKLPRKRVLACARPHDQRARRRGRHVSPAADRRRIGRHARSIVWVRSGPTDTRTIGTPASASTAVTYRRAFSGRPASDRMS